MPQQLNCTLDFEAVKLAAQVFGAIITWALVFGGWYVNNRQNAKRDARKELRERIDSLIGEIWSIEDLCISYLAATTDIKDAPSYWSIVSKLARLTGAVSSLKQTHRVDAQVACVTFRQAITRKAIAGPVRVVLPQNDPSLGKISAAANQLADTLDKSFFDRYPC